MAKMLVVDDEGAMRELLRKALTLKGHQVVTVPNAEQSLELIFKEPFDLVLLDIDLGGESGISILKRIREIQKKLPVVIYSGSLTPARESEVRAAGASEAFSKTMDVMTLAQKLGTIADAKDRIFQEPAKRKEKSVLIIDDETGIRAVLKAFFTSKGYTVFEAASGEEALARAGKEKFSVALCDMNMPGIDGLETLRRLREIDPHLGVVMVTSDQDDAKVQKALASGAYGYVLKPFDFLYLELVVMSKLVIADNG